MSWGRDFQAGQGPPLGNTTLLVLKAGESGAELPGREGQGLASCGDASLLRMTVLLAEAGPTKRGCANQLENLLTPVPAGEQICVGTPECQGLSEKRKKKRSPRSGRLDAKWHRSNCRRSHQVASPAT